MTKKIGIEGMSCGNCVAHVEEALKDLAGVTNVTVTLEDKEAVITGDVSDQDIREAIDDAGYDVISIEELA